jgi:ABC-type uncharacterized transport system ATPase subunit
MQRHSGSGSDFVAVTAQTPGSAKPDPILIADHITRTFGGLTAVNVAHLEIQRGSITALIGPNGAGKTTFFTLGVGVLMRKRSMEFHHTRLPDWAWCVPFN